MTVTQALERLEGHFGLLKLVQLQKVIDAHHGQFHRPRRQRLRPVHVLQRRLVLPQMPGNLGGEGVHLPSCRFPLSLGHSTQPKVQPMNKPLAIEARAGPVENHIRDHAEVLGGRLVAEGRQPALKQRVHALWRVGIRQAVKDEL